MAEGTRKRVLVLGRSPEVLQKVMSGIEALGAAVKGSTDGDKAAERFDARDFDLVVFGSGLVGPISERLRKEFSRRNPGIAFLDAFAPVAVRQVALALGGATVQQQYVSDFRVDEEGADYIIRVTILKPCKVRIEVYRSPDAPPPQIEVVDQSFAAAGPFERRVDGRYREHGHMLYMTLNDDEYCLHRMHAA